jgi:urate oxidase
MGIVLGTNQYGKAENRIVRIYRETPRHEIHDVSVSTALRGDFSLAHTAGDQGAVLPTDTQKQTAYAFAKEKGLLSIEDYGTGADEQVWVTGGLKDMVILKSTGSEFAGFLTDPYTVLQPTHDRVMATSLVAKWRFSEHTGIDWEATYAGIKQILVKQFAQVHSLALQQTLYEMGTAVLEAYDVLAEVRLSAPNKHHFVYDLSPFGLENPGEVFHADDRPYGLIQAQVIREDAPDAGPAWYAYTGLV